jgi:hypothetical protein
MAPEFTLTGELGRGNLLQTRAFSKCLRECKVGTVYSLGSVSSRHTHRSARSQSESSADLLVLLLVLLWDSVFYQVAAARVTSSGVDAEAPIFFNESLCQNLQLKRDLPAIYLSLSSRGSQ